MFAESSWDSEWAHDGPCLPLQLLPRPAAVEHLKAQAQVKGRAIFKLRK